MTPREKILTAAARLFQRKGYNGTGLNEIVLESGAPKGSLYYYFPQGKLQLAIESVGYAGGFIKSHIVARLAEEEDPAKAFQSVLQEIIEQFRKHHSHFEDVALSMVSLEASGEDEKLRRACQAVFDERESLFAEKLVASGYPKKEALRLASLLQALIEGAIVAARTRKDSSALETVLDYIPELLGNKG